MLTHFNAGNRSIKQQTEGTLLEQVWLKSGSWSFWLHACLRIDYWLVINVQMPQKHCRATREMDRLTVATPQRTWQSRAESWDPSEELPLDSCYWQDYSGSTCSITTVPLCPLEEKKNKTSCNDVYITKHVSDRHVRHLRLCPPLSSSSVVLFSPSASDFAAALLDSAAFAAVPESYQKQHLYLHLKHLLRLLLLSLLHVITLLKVSHHFPLASLLCGGYRSEEETWES